MSKKQNAKPLPNRVQQAASSIHQPTKISFALYEAGGNQCMSHCERHKVKLFLACLQRLSLMTWQQVLSQGGKGERKVGLAPTRYEDNSLKIDRPANISPDLPFIGIRAGSAERIFGVNIDNVFYVIWFDPNHDIVKA